MDQQTLTKVRPQFPIVDALLFTPKESAAGPIGICSNTTAPGQVYNDISEECRPLVSVLGPLIVSRDGTERMILNSLAHPSITHLILFSEESLTFSPSTNLLLALMHGLDDAREGNYIKHGQAASAHFPNLSRDILNLFRDHLTVLPLYMSQNKEAGAVLKEYLAWVKPRIPAEVHAFLETANSKDKKYYDALNGLVALLGKAPRAPKPVVALDPKDFQHLQPPKVALTEDRTPAPVPFRASLEDGHLRVDLALGNTTYFIRGDDDFRIEYSLMRALGPKLKILSSREQFLIGAELNRLNIERGGGPHAAPFTEPNEIVGREEVLLEPTTDLVPDKQYYYKIGLKDDEISVMCMAFDICEEVFELRAKAAGAIFTWLAEKNRFESYEMETLHRMDVGGQIGRAAVAAQFGYSFIQDFSSIFKVNRETLPLVISESDTFLDAHRGLLLRTYTQGLTEEHGDERKGLSRTVVGLAIYRDAAQSFERMPNIYKQGEISTDDMRTAYKAQLLRLDHDGDYSYGERTRVHFGFDQLDAAAAALKKDPGRAVLIQRYDPTEDMGVSIDPNTGKPVYTHDPCLTHDLLFVQAGKLHSFHIARAHNLPNAYPENIFGLYDAYVSTVRDRLHLASGDLYMLSSRGNILLLTEEQRVRKIIAEPSKPIGEVNRTSGPALLGDNVRPSTAPGVAYFSAPLKKEKMFAHSLLARIRDFEGVDTLARAIHYLEQKGGAHNNPVLMTHQPGRTDAQGEHLAFFQANVFGKKVYATAVFANHVPDHNADLKLVSALATAFSERLKVPLGEAVVFHLHGEA